MSLKDILSQKAAEQRDAATAATLQQPVTPTANAVATGMQGAGGFNLHQDDVGVDDIVMIPKEPDAELAAKSLGVFKADGLHRFWRKDLTVVNPINGFFYASNDEELTELKHFAKQGVVSEFTK